MSASLERFLARVYAEPAFAAEARARPLERALESGLSRDDAERVAALDWDSVALAAESFAEKRRRKAGHSETRESALGRLWSRIRRSRGARLPRS